MHTVLRMGMMSGKRAAFHTRMSERAYPAHGYSANEGWTPYLRQFVGISAPHDVERKKQGREANKSAPALAAALARCAVSGFGLMDK